MFAKKSNVNASAGENGKLVLLVPAPPTINLPIPVPKETMPPVIPVMNNAYMDDRSKTNDSGPNKIYKLPTMDQIAYNLAIGEARPAKWGDLYWHLIARRQLQSDMEKINALYTWLCYLPSKRNAFVGFEELKQGVDENIEHAVEALQAKSITDILDSPEEATNRRTSEVCSCIQAFESICRYAGIPCCTIHGWAKGNNYSIGMELSRPDTKNKLTDEFIFSKSQHVWNAAYVDGRWCLFDPYMGAAYIAQLGYFTRNKIKSIGDNNCMKEMFYFNTDPAIFVHSHYPLEEKWQLLANPLTLEQFNKEAILFRGFFTHGFGLLSHKDGVIEVEKTLAIKLSVSPSLVKVLKLGFDLELTSNVCLGRELNLSKCGTHEISEVEATITFNFQFPKRGQYNLTIKAKTPADFDFINICEYLVKATG